RGGVGGRPVRRSPYLAGSVERLWSQNSVGASTSTEDVGSGVSSGTSAATSSWKRRANVSASVLSGVWMNTVGERPSRSHWAVMSTHGRQPAAVWVGSSRPRYRTMGWSVSARDRSGSRGFRSQHSPLRLTGRRVPEERGGIERNPFGSDRVEYPFEKARRARMVEERAMPDLHRVPILLRQTVEKGGEERELVRAERSRKLYPQRVDSGPQRFDHVQELAQRVLEVAKTQRMGDHLRQLQHEPEVRSGLLGPRRHGAPVWNRVERGVAFH